MYEEIRLVVRHSNDEPSGGLAELAEVVEVALHWGGDDVGERGVGTGRDKLLWVRTFFKKLM